MAVIQSRSIGVQTQNMFFSSDNSTQTTSLNAMYSFAESLSDWVISEAFRYGRDVEKFAACIADFILLQVFMEKSMNNLTSYVEDCMRADRPYCCLRAEHLEKTSSNALKNLNQVLSKYNTSKTDHHPSCIFKHFEDYSEDWNYCDDDDDDGNQEIVSAISSPDPLQILEDDIIKCLQILTDDEEELFSEISYPSHQHLNQSSELDSGFLSSEDSFSIDHKIINNKKSYLPSLSESLEESTNFSWPEFHIPRREEEKKKGDSDRQQFLRTLLVQELKENIEERKKRNEVVEISNAAPVGPMFKAQATKAIWMPGQSASARECENLSSPVKSENNCIFAQNENDVCQNVSVNENSENFNSKRYNGLSNMSDVGDMEKTGKTFSFNVDPSNVTYNIELTDKPPPKEAVIVDQKVTIKDGNIHQDTYYAMPYDKVTSTKTIIKAPTYEGIGPTEDGVPIGLRTSIKKEYGSDWYKTMFRSLHKCDSNEGLKFQSDGYMSDPELNRKEKSSSIKNKSKTLVTNKAKEKSLKEAEKPSYSFPAAKSTIQTYNHKPWIISDYEPGYSSIANNENSYTNARYLPPLITPQPKYVYNDGYDSDSTLVRKTGKQHTLDPQQQKQWYQNIQKGGEIPLPGLCKPAPQKPQEPVVGPPPPMPSNWDADSYYRIYAPKPDDSQRYTSPLHSPVQNVKRPESSKHKLQDDFLTKLDDVILNKCEDNIRYRKFSHYYYSKKSSSIKNKSKTLVTNKAKEKSLKEAEKPSYSFPAAKSTIQTYNHKPWIISDYEPGYSSIANNENSYIVTDDSQRYTSPLHSPVQNVKRPESSKHKLQDDFLTKLDDVILNKCEDNIRQSPSKSPIGNSSLSLQNVPVSPNKVVILYDFIAQSSRELSLKKGDVVNIQRRIDKNWYEGKIDGKTGIFPVSYAEPVSSKSSQRLSKKYIKGWARAKFDFIAKNQVELTLYKDDMVSLIREVDSNWYEGNMNGKTGIFPISYVELVSESEYSAKPSKPLMPSSTLSPERNGRNEVDINRNDIEDAEIIKNEKAFPVNEVLPSRNTLTKFNFMESEYNNNRVSPYQALYAYKPQNDDELELKEGDVVYVVEKCDDGWFVGTSMRTGLFGTFPGNYIEKIYFLIAGIL
ncbi:uncharacterized protein LOC111625148 [Centruroides sculpturatus]|uniref:uncharacterized protein LOC111625148 n=1 Tax=Centruroides sculpturatus TaxID=218467 RepID=UPI000C6D4AD4|nr:uncharacterized protein LOC111625148 [Centruroides sculpturatus]